jgi:hypothetical protein
MVAHVCNHSTLEAEVGGCEFKASRGYLVRPFLKQTNKQTKVYDDSSPPILCQATMCSKNILYAYKQNEYCSSSFIEVPS